MHRFFVALATAAEQRMGNSNQQELVNTAWALGTSGPKNALWFAELATAAEQRMGNFNLQDLDNTA